MKGRIRLILVFGMNYGAWVLALASPTLMSTTLCYADAVKIIVTEAASETKLSKVTEVDATGKTHQVCDDSGVKGVPKCSDIYNDKKFGGLIPLPVPLVDKGIVDVAISEPGEPTGDSIGFGVLAGGVRSGITGFGSDAGNDNSPAETDLWSGKVNNHPVEITIYSPCEGTGKGNSPTCAQPTPEPPSWLLVGTFLLGLAGFAKLKLCRT